MDQANGEFHTVRGYELLRQEGNRLSPSMEDYLEMAFRLARGRGYVRVSDLAAALHVQPPSASKMAQKLAEMGYFKYERYGLIELTPLGRELGAYFLKRHETIEAFLRLIGVLENVLEEAERIEHSVSRETAERIMTLVQFLQANRGWVEDFRLFQSPDLL